MKTIEQLEAELRDALARERQLREAVESVFPLIIAGNASELAYHFENGKPLGGVTKEALCVWLRSVRDHFESFSKALTTPAPRVFTAEEVKPLVEALDRGFNLIAHANPHAFDNGVKDGSGTIDEGDVVSGHIYEEMRNALTHARKLGMEGGE